MTAVIAIAFAAPSVCSASGSNIYIAQNAAGGASGADCADALPVSFFNNSANWGSGSTQIGPGTTVHLCGTFTAAAGASGYLTFQGSGASGNPITLEFESGAILEAPYWGTSGAISADGLNYIVVNGGSNGEIQATANGTGLANTQDGSAIFFQSVSNSEIENLTISNIYVHASNPTDENGQNTYGIHWDFGSNVTIDDNTIHDAKWCSYYAYEGSSSSSNVSVYSNSIYNCDHDIVVGDGNTNAGLSTATIHDNVLHDWANWDDDDNDNHHDGIHTWAVANGDTITGMEVYNNYIYGNGGFGINAWIYMESGESTTGTNNGSLVFNNVVIDGGTTSHEGCGYICTLNNQTQVYDNTVVGQTTSNNVGLNFYGTNISAKNNIVSTVQTGIATVSGATIASDGVNNNDYYNLDESGAAFEFSGSFIGTFSGWQGACNCDSSSITSNPNLASNYLLLSGSPAIGAGVNLTSLDVTALDSDKAGVLRPSTGAWAMGAYQSGTSSAPQPATGLTAVAH